MEVPEGTKRERMEVPEGTKRERMEVPREMEMEQRGHHERCFRGVIRRMKTDPHDKWGIACSNLSMHAIVRPDAGYLREYIELVVGRMVKDGRVERIGPKNSSRYVLRGRAPRIK